jgi:hypothetical protein
MRVTRRVITKTNNSWCKPAKDVAWFRGLRDNAAVPQCKERAVLLRIFTAPTTAAVAPSVQCGQRPKSGKACGRHVSYPGGAGIKGAVGLHDQMRRMLLPGRL